jgi:hypothetical protein
MYDSGDLGGKAFRAALIIIGMLITLVGMGAAMFIGVRMLTGGSMFGAGLVLLGVM